MGWPEKETFDEMMKRFARKCLAERDKPRFIVEVEPAARAATEPAERMNRPSLKRVRLPPQTQRFPTDEELDRMWGIKR